MPFGKGKEIFRQYQFPCESIYRWLANDRYFSVGIRAYLPVNRFDDGTLGYKLECPVKFGFAIRQTARPPLLVQAILIYLATRWQPIPATAIPIRVKSGDRNVLREPGYIATDMGLYKAFTIREGLKLTFPFGKIFNLTNTQHFY